MATYPAIPENSSLDWAAIAKQSLQECDEPLVPLCAQSSLKLIPSYFQQNIDGAINALVLRQTAAEKLYQAADKLPENFGLAVYDGWRPLRVQRALRELVRAEIVAKHPDADEVWIANRLDEFVANPDREGMCAPHLTGGSVDLTLFDTRTGEVLDMGSAFDEAGHLSYTAALEPEADSCFAKAREYRRILYAAMTEVGFTNIPTEWWHFDYGNHNWAYFSGASHAIYGAAEWINAA